MKEKLQIDNPTHSNKAKEREKAIKALEKAKTIPRKVVVLPKGVSADLKTYKKTDIYGSK